MADAVEDLLAVVAFVFDVGAFFAEAALSGAGIFAVEFRGFVRDGGTGAGEGEAVDGGVGVAHQVDGFVESGFAALVDGFAEEKDCTAVAGRLFTKLIDGKCDGVENGGAAVAFCEIGEFACGLVGVCGERLDDVRGAVEGDDGDVVLDVADDGVENGVESTIVVEMARAGAAGFDDDGKS